MSCLPSKTGERDSFLPWRASEQDEGWGDTQNIRGTPQLSNRDILMQPFLKIKDDTKMI